MMVESTNVFLRGGRVILGGTGLWNNPQITYFSSVAHSIKATGAVAGIQVVHAGVVSRFRYALVKRRVDPVPKALFFWAGTSHNSE